MGRFGRERKEEGGTGDRREGLDERVHAFILSFVDGNVSWAPATQQALAGSCAGQDPPLYKEWGRKISR